MDPGLESSWSVVGVVAAVVDGTRIHTLLILILILTRAMLMLTPTRRARSCNSRLPSAQESANRVKAMVKAVRRVRGVRGAVLSVLLRCVDGSLRGQIVISKMRMRMRKMMVHHRRLLDSN